MSSHLEVGLERRCCELDLAARLTVNKRSARSNRNLCHTLEPGNSRPHLHCPEMATESSASQDAISGSQSEQLAIRSPHGEGRSRALPERCYMEVHLYEGKDLQMELFLALSIPAGHRLSRMHP